MFIKIPSATNLGLETIGVDVEVNIASRGLPVFEIVGLPGKAIGESRERVKTAIVNSGFDFPARRIIVNLAPADLPKEGSFYDLPIATGIISQVLNVGLPKDSLFFGELSLDGNLRHTKGALLLAMFAKERGFKNVFVPRQSANEAAIIKDINVYPVDNLCQLFNHLLKKSELKPFKYQPNFQDKKTTEPEFDMKEILGQEQAKRAIEIAASGGHNIFMVGSPGSGKTMLARALPDILPPLSEKEALEVTKIYSAAGQIPAEGSLLDFCPFRAPHHSISQVGLIGGGVIPKPGEISLAHRGVLFLDEFSEFPRSVLEALRQPLEEGYLTISRSRNRITYPARFILVASSNPCPCGYLYHPKKRCVCTEREIKKYQKKISGPILDRIDLQVEVPVVDVKDLSQHQKAEDFLEPSEKIKQRVIKAREIQRERFKKEKIFTNAEMKNNHIKKYCALSLEARRILNQAVSSFDLSARAYFKMIKISRTIADLEGEGEIKAEHMAEALQYRLKNTQEG